MSTAVPKGLIIIGGISVSGVGGWQAYENLRPITILERLESEGNHSFAPFEATWDNAAWKNIAKKYKPNGSNPNLNGVTIADVNNPKQNEMESLIKECVRLLELNTRWEDRADEIEKVKKWCTS